MVGALNQTNPCYKTKSTKPKSKPIKPKSNISTNTEIPKQIRIYKYPNRTLKVRKRWSRGGGAVEVRPWLRETRRVRDRGGETVTPWNRGSETRWSRGGGAVEVRPWECLTVRSWECLTVRHRSATMTLWDAGVRDCDTPKSETVIRRRARLWTPEIETDESES